MIEGPIAPALRKPFPPDRISWRVGSTNGDKTKGMALAYIDARDVQDRLDEVMGPNWQCRYIPMHDKKTVCEIGLKIDSEWVWRADGAGDSDVEAEKGALSDAFKRAAVKWGIGRYLYDLDSPWVALEAAGRSFKIAAPEYKRLEALLSKGSVAPAPQTQRDAIHTPKTMNTNPDVEAGVRNWLDKQMLILAKCETLPEALAWEDSQTDAIHRLLRKAPKAHTELMQYYTIRKTALSKVGEPA